MNIFVLDIDPQKAAQYHCNKHVIKMITETCQMLSTYANDRTNIFKPTDFVFYKSTHKHHPCTKWLSESKANVHWLTELLGNLIIEYDYRYNKPNKFIVARKMYKFFSTYYFTSNIGKMTPFALAMDDQYKIIFNNHNKTTVSSYRNYYKHGKTHLLIYTKRKKPSWLNL